MVLLEDRVQKNQKIKILTHIKNYGKMKNTEINV